MSRRGVSLNRCAGPPRIHMAAFRFAHVRRGVLNCKDREKWRKNAGPRARDSAPGPALMTYGSEATLGNHRNSRGAANRHFSIGTFEDRRYAHCDNTCITYARMP